MRALKTISVLDKFPWYEPLSRCGEYYMTVWLIDNIPITNLNKFSHEELRISRADAERKTLTMDREFSNELNE